MIPGVQTKDVKASVDKAYQILKNAVLGNSVVVKDLIGGKWPADDVKYCFYVKELIAKFVVDQVVIFGRQPSLHKFSIRAYWPIPVEGKAIQIPPLVCKGYNADFDGDTGYVIAPLTVDAKKNAWDRLSVGNGIVNPGTGGMIVEPHQDILVGLYYATSFEGNEVVPRSRSIVFYQSLDVLLADLDLGFVKVWEFVGVTVGGRNYVSTAGRVAFNSVVPGGFGKKRFVDKYGLGVGASTCALRYDGVVTGRVTDPERQVSAQKIFREIYDEFTSPDRYDGIVDPGHVQNQVSLDRERIISFYQKISEFGFKWSERSGVTFRLDDLKQPEVVSEFLRSAKNVIEEIDLQFQMGLLSERGRKDAVMQVYETVSTKKFKNEFIASLGRKNNLFIMYDSKARGSEDQIMQTCGLLGVLQKTKDSSIDIPIVRNYTNGLSSFDLFETSYATRLDLLSTILETSKPGELTRTLIYEFSGLFVGEDSCGEGGPVRISYKIDSEFVKLNGVSVEKSEILGLRVVDSLAVKFCKNFGEGDVVSEEAFQSLLGSGIPWFETEAGRVEFETSFPEIWSKLLLNRMATAEYPGLKDGKWVTSETIQWFQKVLPREVCVRLLISCVSKDGICADCYGLKYDPVVQARKGEFLGSESAQAIGEPSAQLTMSLFHKGGKAGESIEDGVTLIKSAMQHANIRVGDVAVCSPSDGYVCCEGGKLSVSGEDGSGSILPPCQMCSKTCKRFEGGKVFDLSSRVQKNDLLVESGEFVLLGKQLTKGSVHPIESFLFKGGLSVVDDRLGIVNPGLDLLTHVRFELTKFYYDTYKANGIDLLCRHFEIPAFLQTNFVVVLRSEVPELLPGKRYEFGKVFGRSGVDFYLSLSPASEIILRNAGAVTAFCYQDAYHAICRAASSGPVRERSTLGALLTGTCLIDYSGLKAFKPFEIDEYQMRRVQGLRPVKQEVYAGIFDIGLKDEGEAPVDEIQFDVDMIFGSLGVDEVVGLEEGVDLEEGVGVEESIDLDDFFGDSKKVRDLNVF
jgi:hypothetical protein